MCACPAPPAERAQSSDTLAARGRAPRPAFLKPSSSERRTGRFQGWEHPSCREEGRSCPHRPTLTEAHQQNPGASWRRSQRPELELLAPRKKWDRTGTRGISAHESTPTLEMTEQTNK